MTVRLYFRCTSKKQDCRIKDMQKIKKYVKTVIFTDVRNRTYTYKIDELELFTIVP